MRKSRKQRAVQAVESTAKPVVVPKDRILRMHGWRVLVLWTLVAAAYSNSFQAGLVFDNAVIIGEDPRIRSATPQNIRLILNKEYWYTNATSGLYRPVTTFSYLMNYAVLGNRARPAGYHWINLALHATNVALVYALGIFVLGETGLAFALAALWGLHPLLTESVTNIVGRADLLAAFGVLAGLLCYLRSAAGSGLRRVVWLVALAVAQTIGLFSKESAAVLPGIMLLYDLTWRSRAAWRDRLIAYGILILPLALFFYLRSDSHTQMHVVFSENPLIGAGFWTARITAVKIIGKFLWLFLWPMYLSADYSYNAVPLFTGLDDIKALVALAICLGVMALAIARRTFQRPQFFFVGFFFIALSPVSNLILVIGSIMAERFVYLPSVGLAGCVIIAIQWLEKGLSATRPAQTAWIVVGLICIAFGTRTYARNFDWQDERSLWTSAVRVSPESARAHNNLGNALMQTPGDLPEAMVEFEAALRIRPDYAEAHYNRGKVLAQTGRLGEAIGEYQAALRYPPDYSKAQHDATVHISLGNALARIPGRLPDAIAEYQAALRIQPDRSDAHYNLGNALAPASLEDAIAEWTAAVRIDPDLADAHYNLGIALARMPRRLADAAAEFEATLRLKPDHARAHNNLGSVLLQMPGRTRDAIAEYQAAVRTDPGMAEAHYNLGNALLQIPGRRADAIAEFETALRIKPDPAGRMMLDRLRAAPQ